MSSKTEIQTLKRNVMNTFKLIFSPHIELLVVSLLMHFQVLMPRKKMLTT